MKIKESFGKKTKLPNKVIAFLTKLIGEGELKPGDRLYSEEELVGMLNVSRSTIREAVKAMELLGIIETRPGVGMFVSNEIERFVFSQPELYTNSLYKLVPISQLVEAREIIEVNAIKLAIKRFTEEDERNMREILAKMEKSLHIIDAYCECHVDFHIAIAKASKNMVLYSAAIGVKPILREGFKKVVMLRKEGLESTVKRHYELLEAIVAGDVKKAEELMRQHLTISLDVLV